MATIDSNKHAGLCGQMPHASQAAATPSSHDVGVQGMPGAFAGLNGKLGELKHLPPTLSVVYYPLDGASAFQSYAGLGINCTWGLAAQLGMDYMLTDKLLLNAHARYLDIDTTSFAGEKVKVDVDVDVDPFVYMVGLGYTF